MQQVHGKLFLRFSKLRKWRFKTDGEMSVVCIAPQKVIRSVSEIQ